MILTVHAKPGARKTEVRDMLDATTVKISLAAPAQQGKANRELVRFLATVLGVPKTRIEIVRGKTTRMKHVQIDGLTEKEAQNLLCRA